MNMKTNRKRVFWQAIGAFLIFFASLWTAGLSETSGFAETMPAAQNQQIQEPSQLACTFYEMTFIPNYFTDEKDVQVYSWQAFQDASKRVYFFYAVTSPNVTDGSGSHYDLYCRYTDDGQTWSQKSLVVGAFSTSVMQFDDWISFKVVLAPDGNPCVYLVERYIDPNDDQAGWKDALRTVSLTNGIFQLSPDKISFQDENGIPLQIARINDVKYDKDKKPMVFYMSFDMEGHSPLYMNDTRLSQDYTNVPTPLIENLPDITPWYFDSKGNVHCFFIETADLKSRVSHSFSTDSGKTWSKPAVILDDLSNPAVADVRFNDAGDLTVLIENGSVFSNPYALFEGTIKFNESAVQGWKKYIDRYMLAEAFRNDMPDSNGLFYASFYKAEDWGPGSMRIVGQLDYHVDIIIHSNGEYVINKINHSNMNIQDSYILSNEMLFLIGTDASNNLMYGIAP
jgi:hypothetical protein